MALRYPTQTLRVAALAPTLSILHFMTSDGSHWDPTYQTAVRTFTSLRPPMAYTIIKEKKQVEYTFIDYINITINTHTSIIRRRARCALPMPMKFHPVAWLPIPLNQETGAADSFADWNTEVVLRVLATIIQRLGGRKRGEAPTRLRYPYVCDTSRMYCARTNPRVHTARMLDATTCWSKPELVVSAVHQLSLHMKATIPSVAREPSKRILPVSTEVPSNPRAALEIFLSLRSRLKERGQSVGEEYAGGIQIFKNLFIQYGRQELADNLPEFPLGGITSGNNQRSITAPGSSQQLAPEMPSPKRIEVQMEDDQENPSITAGPLRKP